MKILWSAYYEFLKNIRDIRILIALILFPISIIILLGTAFNGNLTEDFKNRVKAGYVILDKGQVGKGIEEFLKTDDINKIIAPMSYSTEAEAQRAIETGKIDNYILIPESTSGKVENEQIAVIRIEGKKNLELIQTILNSYIYRSNAISVAMELSGGHVDIQRPIGISETFERITPANAKLPEAIDYYSVLTLLQVILMGSILGIMIVNRSQESNLHIRLYALPTSKWTIISGKVLGTAMVLFLSCMITVVFTKYVYHANWEGNLLLIGSVLMIFSFISIGIGIMVHALTNSIVPSLGISFLIMLFAAVAGGAITPTVTIQSLNIINPIYYTKVLIFGAIYNYPEMVMYKAAGGLLAILAVIYAISILKLRRVNYDNI